MSGAKAAKVLFSITSTDRSLDPAAPTITVCRMPDGRFAVCESDGSEVVVIGSPIGMVEASVLAMSVIDGDAQIALDPHTVHAIATAYLGLLASASLKAREHSSGPVVLDPVVVEFPSARGAG